MPKYILKGEDVYLETTDYELLEFTLTSVCCDDCFDEACYNFGFNTEKPLVEHLLLTDCGTKLNFQGE